MAADSIFIDTNVLVYATIPSSPMHAAAIAALHRIAQAGTEGWISRQVLREYLVQLTRPGVLPVQQVPSLAASQASALLSIYRVADETSSVTNELLAFLASGLASGKQIHDANVVATCRVYGIRRLLKHNVSDFARFSTLLTIESL